MSRTYTLQDLQALTLSELHALRGTLYRELALAPPHSEDARQTFASLDAVNRVIRQRATGPRMG
ncbi:hypothetical protein GCM10007276_08570 [Agaricicola taiwanensis]|uniref:Uncharacterized protein n=1 Tax=Agaricicola taiwanensis TaxID=591372 RepID=A0A8J2VN76_9RHOB|nr:hypothetical protein [Agaricicola taiwanensis]GGE33568.1 hypothetical protein GCM10007276_08570 [Agaricicola taiwanensis]